MLGADTVLTARPSPLQKPLAAGTLSKEELANLIEKGRLLLKDEKYEEAGLIFQQAVQAAPHSYRAHYGLGRAMLELGRYFKAEENFLACTMLGPHENLARFGMAEVYEHMGRFADAVLVYQQIRKRAGADGLDLQRVDHAMERLAFFRSLGNPRDKDYLDRSAARRWKRSSFPLRVAIWSDPELKDLKEPFQQAVLSAFNAWSKASGELQFKIVDSQKDADIVCKLVQVVRGSKYVALGQKAGETLWQWDDTKLDTVKFTRIEVFWDKKWDLEKLRACVLHEAGHSLGLEHSSNPHDIMFPIANAPFAAVLSERDRNTIHALYQDSQPFTSLSAPASTVKP